MQAASLLLDRHGGSMPYIKLINLLYLADRESLIETGSPITGDKFVSLRFGPALSRVFELIKESDPDEHSVWHAYVARSRYAAVLVGAAESDRLSRYEEGVLDGVFADSGRWGVVARTRALPEWIDPGRSTLPIEPENILRYAGYRDEEVQAASAQAEAVYSLHRRLAPVG